MSYIPPNKGVRNWGRKETVTTCHRLTQLWEHPGLCREGENKPAASQKTRLSRQFPLLLGKKNSYFSRKFTWDEHPNVPRQKRTTPLCPRNSN